jgi:hypothetical protein
MPEAIPPQAPINHGRGPFRGPLRHAEFASVLPLGIGVHRAMSELEHGNWLGAVLATATTAFIVILLLGSISIASRWLGPDA